MIGLPDKNTGSTGLLSNGGHPPDLVANQDQAQWSTSVSNRTLRRATPVCRTNGHLYPMKCGPGRTRTCGDRSRRIYSPMQLPLCDRPMYLPLMRQV